MKPEFLFGAGGGGSGGSRNIPDNLRSTDTFEALIGVVSGPIKGLKAGGLKNLYVNGVAAEDSQGKSTLTDFSARLFTGDPALLSPIKLALGGSSGPTQVGQNINNDSDGSVPGEWRYAAIEQSGCDFIDLRFVVQTLYRLDKKGTYNETATLEVELQATGMTSWYNPLSSSAAPTYNGSGIQLQPGLIGIFQRKLWAEGFQDKWAEATGKLTITGKTTSPFVKELRIAVPNTGEWAGKTWQVRVRLIERDEYNNASEKDPKEEYRKIGWESIAGVKSAPIGNDEAWRGLAYLHILGKASDQITGIPDIFGVYDLALPKCPPSSVWNPETRVYTGTAWDGATYQNAWTQCPAWLISNFIEDDLSGVAALAPGAKLNKWDTLEASKWFGELVPNGKGGTHPRYSLNYVFDQPLDVDDAVNYLAGAVGGFAWDQGDGDWRMVVEKPENPVAIFTEENIVGEFSYSHTDVDTRFNDITGIFLDEDRLYEETRVRVFDQADIDANGRRPTTITLVGCSNRQEALRRIYLRLLSSLNETRVTTFTTNRQGRLLQQFGVVGVADGSLGDSAKKTTGRILSLDGTRKQITLRDPVRLELGVTYQLVVTVPNPNYNPAPTSQPTTADWNKPTIVTTVNVSNTAAQRGDIKTLYLATALPANTPENANFSLVAAGLPAIPKQYRILDLKVNDENPEFVTVVGMEVYTSKWVLSDAITEEAINTQVSDRTVNAPLPPTDGQMLRLNAVQFEGETRVMLEAAWQRPAGTTIEGFEVRYGFNGGTLSAAQFTRDLAFEIPEPSAGLWRVEVVTLDRRGYRSDVLAASIDVTDATLDRVRQLGASVDEAQAQITALASDGVLSAGKDKSRAIVDHDTLRSDFDLLEAKFNALGQPSDTADEYSAASTAITDLEGYLGLLTPAWDNVALDTVIDPTTWRLRWTTAYNAIAALRTAISGQSGLDGYNFARPMIYQRASSAPALPTATVTFDFATGTLTGLNNGWQATIPTGTSPLYASTATASSRSSSDTIDPLEWAGAVVLAQNGSNGAAGANSRTITLYQRAATAPSKPSATITHTFSTNATTGITNGWSVTPPAGTDPLWVTLATAFSNTASDTIASSEWSNPEILVRDGQQGPSGLNNATVLLYQRAASAPALPSADVIYTFAPAGVSGLTNGWQTTIPAGSNPLYVTAATASAVGGTDTITPAEWAAVTIMAQNGATGTAGLNTKSVFLYQRAASAPALPSATITHTFATNVTTGMTNGWLTAIPAGTDPIWVTTATALSNTASDTIAAGEWTAAVVLAQNGLNGAPGSNNATVMLYQRAASAPSLPSADVTYTFGTGAVAGLTNGWQATVPAGTSPLYVTAATASATGATDTITSTEWAAATVMAQNGANGTAGTNTKSIFLYQRATSAPAVPSATVTHTFSTNATTGITNGWSTTIPAGTDPIYVTTATALSNTASDTIATGEWSTPTILAQNGAKGDKGDDGYTNMLDMSSWLPGNTGSAGRFGQNGINSENSIVLMAGPSGGSEPVWKCISQDPGTTAGDQTGDGGWGYTLDQATDGFDPRKSYRMLVWARQTGSIPTEGGLYFGTGSNQAMTTLTGGTPGGDGTNPYFWLGNLPQLDKWYLLVGIVHGSGYTGNDSGLSGVYDPDTGQRIATGGDWKLASTATSLNHRAYLYYAPNQQTAFFAKPAVEEMGNVAFTVQQLMATVGMTAAQRLELTAAQARITSISSDSVLDRSEKRQATVDWTTLTNDNGALDSRYLALGSPADLTTVRNASVSRITELATYLSGLTPAWDNAASDTPIVAATWKEKWNLAYAAVASFRAAILGKTGSPFPMTARGSGFIDGNKIGKSASGTGSAYDSDVYSTTGYRGGAYLSFRASQINQALLVGLSADPSVDQSYGNMAASWHLSGNGRCYIYTGTTSQKDVDTYDTNTSFAITYDGQFFRWFRNGVEVFSRATTPNQLFYFDSTFYQPNIGVKDVAFGPMTTASAGTMTLLPINSNTSVQGSSVSCYTDGGWGAAAAVSQESYTGGCSATFTLPANGGKNIMVGLSQTGFSSDAGFPVITFALHHDNNGATAGYINGNIYANGPNIATSSAIGKVDFDGRYVRWSINGNVFATFDWMGTTGDPNAPANKLFFRCALASSQPRLDNIVFVPRGTAGKNGVDGLPGDKGANGTTWYPYYAYANSPDGNVDFTTGQPGTRAYIGVGTGTSPTEPEIPGLYSWTAYKGPPFGIATRGTAIVAGDQVIKATGVESWDSDAYSTVGYRAGATATFQFSAGAYAMAGLNDDPTGDQSYGSLNHAFFGQPDGTLQIYESGNPGPGVGTYDANTKLQVQYDGRYIRYYKDGTLVRGPIDVGADKLFYFDSSLARVGGRITNLGFTANGTIGADGVSPMTGSPSQTTLALTGDVNGVPTGGQLPKYISNSATVAGSAVTITSLSNLVVSGCTATIDGTNIRIDTVTASTAYVKYNINAAGQTVQASVSISTSKAPAPPAEATSAAIVFNRDITATSYQAQTPSVLLNTGGNSSVRISGRLDWSAYWQSGASRSANLRLQMQYRSPGGTWTNFGTEQIGQVGAFNSGFENEPGYLDYNQAVPGFANNTTYEFQALVYKTGTSTAAGGVSCFLSVARA